MLAWYHLTAWHTDMSEVGKHDLHEMQKLNYIRVVS